MSELEEAVCLLCIRVPQPLLVAHRIFLESNLQVIRVVPVSFNYEIMRKKGHCIINSANMIYKVESEIVIENLIPRNISQVTTPWG